MAWLDGGEAVGGYEQEVTQGCTGGDGGGSILVGPLGLAVGGVDGVDAFLGLKGDDCLLYTSPSPRDRTRSRMPSSA